MNLKSSLLKVVDLCNAHNITYVITGTCALTILGMPSQHKPGDIDIKVFNLTPEQERVLATLENLSGPKKQLDEYSHTCYTFNVDSCKVNAIVCRAENHIINAQTLRVLYEDYFIRVQPVNYALVDKMALNRPKDKEYMLALIASLSSLASICGRAINPPTTEQK